MNRKISYLTALLTTTMWLTSASSQEHHHGHGDKPVELLAKIFLDKILDYQLSRS